MDNGEPPKPTINHKIFAGCFLAIVLLIPVGWLLLPFMMPSEEWMKARIQDFVQERYNADIQIGAITLDPRKGAATATDVTIARQQPDQDVQLTIESIAIEMSVLPLLWRDVNVKTIEINSPSLTMVVQREPEAELKPTLDRATDLVFSAVSKFIIEPVGEMVIVIIEVIFGPSRSPEFEYHIDSLVIRDGAIDFTANREGTPSFHAEFKDLSFHAKDIDPTSPMDFVKYANIEASLRTGGEWATYHQSYQQPPYQITLKNLDIGYADRAMKQKDALIIAKGVVDIDLESRSTDDGGGSDVGVVLRGLELQKNPDAPQDDFVFMSVDSLIEYVNEHGNRLKLGYHIGDDAFETTDDLNAMTLAIWEGLWKELFKIAAAKGVEETADKVKGKIEGFFKQPEEPKTDENN